MIIINSILLFLFDIFVIISTKPTEIKLENLLFACHTTDFECFKRQYFVIRDHVLLGNKKLEVNFYKPYIFKYGDTKTCIKITGVERSELVAVGMNINSKAYAMTIKMPLNIEQINQTSVPCATPDKNFDNIKPKTDDNDDTMKTFSGNATVSISYPYVFHTKKNKTFMLLENENMDVVLDIPDYSDYDNTSDHETEMFERSEWAYGVVQHVDVAQHCMLPYTSQLRRAMDRFPLDRFLLLYPGETYSTLQFSFNYDIEPPDE